MPYKDKEKQRQYQRKWMRKYRKRKNLQIEELLRGIRWPELLPKEEMPKNQEDLQLYIEFEFRPKFHRAMEKYLQTKAILLKKSKESKERRKKK